MALKRHDSIIMRRLFTLLIIKGPTRATTKFRNPKAKLSHKDTAKVNPDWVKMSTE